MFSPIPLWVWLALPFLGLLAVALAIWSASRRAPLHRAVGRALAHAGILAAPLVDYLDNALAAMATATARDAPAAYPIAVEVLLEDRALRERTKRRVRDTLARCATTMGAPTERCAVLVARTLEREGRRIGSCVERLACPDGTTRTVIWLAFETGPDVSSLDAVAARLAGCYPVAIGAEPTLLLVDGPLVRIPPPIAAVPRAASPEPPMLAPLPPTTGARRA